MAHELTQRANGTFEMAYVGDTPWHGLGQKLEKSIIVDERGQQIERQPSIEEWVSAAGMDWKIARSRVRYGEGAHQRIIEDQHVLFRSDTKDHLGIVSDRYQIVQPRDVMEFFRDLTECAGFTLETAGTLFGGRRFWALAHIGKSAVIKSVADVVGGYLLLSTSADGSLATSGRFTTVCVVCNNTLSMALSGKAKHEIKLSHRSKFDANKMKDQLGIERDGFTAWAQQMKLLAMESCGIEASEQYVFELLSDKDWEKATAEEVTNVRDSRGFKTIMALFNGEGKGATIAGRSGTRWGLLNAVTEYYDYHVRAQSTENRLASAWFGDGDKAKTKMLELLTV